MAIIKTTQWPLLAGTNWITDFFDTERFFDSEWMKKIQVVPAVNVNERVSGNSMTTLQLSTNRHKMNRPKNKTILLPLHRQH